MHSRSRRAEGLTSWGSLQRPIYRHSRIRIGSRHMQLLLRSSFGLKLCDALLCLRQLGFHFLELAHFRISLLRSLRGEIDQILA